MKGYGAARILGLRSFLKASAGLNSFRWPNLTAACFHAHVPIPVQYEAYDPASHSVDFCVTLGGDGTVLHLASLFEADDPLPPVVSFAMGTLWVAMLALGRGACWAGEMPALVRCMCLGTRQGHKDEHAHTPCAVQGLPHPL